MYGVLQLLFEFTNETCTDLWIECELEDAAVMSALSVFFKSSNTGTKSGSGEMGPNSLPPIGVGYALSKHLIQIMVLIDLQLSQTRSIQTLQRSNFGITEVELTCVDLGYNINL